MKMRTVDEWEKYKGKINKVFSIRIVRIIAYEMKKIRENWID